MSTSSGTSSQRPSDGRNLIYLGATLIIVGLGIQVWLGLSQGKESAGTSAKRLEASDTVEVGPETIASPADDVETVDVVPDVGEAETVGDTKDGADVTDAALLSDSGPTASEIGADEAAPSDATSAAKDGPAVDKKRDSSRGQQSRPGVKGTTRLPKSEDTNL